MKIPQRNDQVQLGAPQTQAGRAVQPVEGSLGDSYTKTMQSLSKSFQELSDLQFKLSENAIEGQLNAFNIYVDSRTKQYNKDISMATNKQQIDELYQNYIKDVSETGDATLGSNLYQNWKRVKGGTTIAGAEYTGKLAATQLQQKKNLELYKDSAIALNIEAGNAEGKERENIINQFVELTNDNVANGTMTEADAESKIRQFNYDLDVTDIKRLIEVDPYKAIEKLHTNDFATNVAYPEREKFVHAAEQEIASTSGTSKGISKFLKNDWILRYSSQDWTKAEDGKTVNKQRELAYAIYDESTEKPLETARKYAKLLGLDPSKVNADDAIAFRTFMLQTFDFNDQARNDAFNQAYDDAKGTVNRLKTFQSESGKLSLDKNPFSFVMGFDSGSYPNVTKDSIDSFISSYYTANDMFGDSYSRALLAKNEQARALLQEQNNLIADVIVEDLDKRYFYKDGYYGNMREHLRDVKKRLENAGLLYGDDKKKMRNVVKYLLDNNRVETLFDGKQEESVVNTAVEKALAYGLKPVNEFESIAELRIAHGMSYSGTVQQRLAALDGEKKK